MNKKLPIWIQGFDKYGKFTGSFDPIDLPPWSYKDVMNLIKNMPKMIGYSEDICPPQIGFTDGHFCISRDAEGNYYLHPHEIGLKFDQIPKYIQEYWEKIQGYKFDMNEAISFESQQSEQKIKYCIHCGKQIKQTAKFCAFCGKEQ